MKLVDTLSGKPQTIADFDHVVIRTHGLPDDGLYFALLGRIGDVIRIGDAIAARTAERRIAVPRPICFAEPAPVKATKRSRTFGPAFRSYGGIGALAQLEEQLQRDIDRIRDKVREMADLALRGLEDSVSTLMSGDCRLAYAAILRDSRIDDLESVVDNRCVEFMVRHIPVAKHLRFSHSVAKIVSELERVGDYAESINRQAILLSHAPHKPDLAPYQQLAQVAIDAIRQAVRAFLDEDLDLAAATWTLDAQANGLHQEIYRSLVGHKPAGSEDLSTVFALLSVANRFERVADQASNICEEVFYIVTGKIVKHELRRDLQILFFSSAESCRSPMAEAIAKTIAGKHFEFFSAVVGNGSADPRAIEALARRGIPQPTSPPKTVDALDDIGRFRVVVAIGKDVARALPKLAFRTILLEWDVADPLSGVDDDESVRRRYERMFDELVERITELIRSLHGTIEKTKPGVNVHA